MRDDAYLQRQISRVLAVLQVAWIRVEVEAGIVYVEGVVETARHKQLLTRLLSQMPGVQGVINCLALEHVAPRS